VTTNLQQQALIVPVLVEQQVVEDSPPAVLLLRGQDQPQHAGLVPSAAHPDGQQL
jgi:hypothetical protein